MVYRKRQWTSLCNVSSTSAGCNAFTCMCPHWNDGPTAFVLCCIQPTVPQAWATVQISTPSDDSAIVGREFVMTCTVTAVRGLTVIPRVVWIGPDGDLTGTKNITMGYKQTYGLVTTRSLTLQSLQSSEGGQYSCMAASMKYYVLKYQTFLLPLQTTCNLLCFLHQLIHIHSLYS